MHGEHEVIRQNLQDSWQDQQEIAGKSCSENAHESLRGNSTARGTVPVFRRIVQIEYE